MSDEDDYMSDAFLASLEDKRPGLIHGKKAKRLIQEERVKVRFISRIILWTFFFHFLFSI